MSPYSNPLVVVIKKDGKVRLCLDARRINQIIIPDRESPESIDKIFQKFSGGKVYNIIRFNRCLLEDTVISRV